MDLMKKPRHTLGLNLVEPRNISSFRTPRVVSSFYKRCANLFFSIEVKKHFPRKRWPYRFDNERPFDQKEKKKV